MMRISQIDLPALTKVYLFANTPMYLYNHFRGNSSLQLLATYTSIQDLVNEFTARTDKEKRTLEDIVVGYSVLIIISFLDYKRALEAFEQMDMARIEWGVEIKAIYINSARVTNVFRESVKLPVRLFIDTTRSSGSQNSLSTSPKPKIDVRN